MQKDGLKKYVILRPFGDAARGLISFLKQKGREVEDACARAKEEEEEEEEALSSCLVYAAETLPPP